MQEAKDNCKFYDNKERELKEKIEQDKKVKEELQLAVSLELEEAKGVCDRETAQSYLGEGGKELPLEDVKKNYTLAKRRVEEEKKRHDRPQEDVLKSLKDAKNALKRLETRWVTRADLVTRSSAVKSSPEDADTDRE